MTIKTAERMTEEKFNLFRAQNELTAAVKAHNEDQKKIREAKKGLAELKAKFCDCGNEKFGEYVEDGACACGIKKHHIHCLNCGKIIQIG